MTNQLNAVPPPMADEVSASASPVGSVPTRRRVEACLSCGSPKRRELFRTNGFQLDQCCDCGLAYIIDPPTAEELARFYSFASNYHSDFATNAATQAEFIRRGRLYLSYLTKQIQSGELLDVGCSAGFFMKVASENGFSVTGLEYSKDSADLGRSLNQLEIHTGDLHSQTFAPNSFDVITLWDVIEHLPNPLGAMQHACRLLRPGGVVAISTPNIGGLFPRLSYLPGRWLNHWPHPTPPAHLTQFSVKTLAGLLQRAGLQVTQTSTRRIPLSYTFGSLPELLRMPKRLLYACAFAPSAWIAPYIGMGDEVVMIARKPG